MDWHRAVVGWLLAPQAVWRIALIVTVLVVNVVAVLWETTLWGAAAGVPIGVINVALLIDVPVAAIWIGTELLVEYLRGRKRSPR